MTDNSTTHKGSLLSDVVHGRLTHVPASIEQSMNDFDDTSQEWRRLFSELLGTFFLVLVAAGGGMMGQAFPDTITRTDAVIAPGLMVLAVILFMGKVSGAHLNPAVSIALRLARRFPVVACARVHHRSARRREPRRAVPAGGDSRVRLVRIQLPGVRVLGRCGVPDGARSHLWTGQRHPRHRIGSPERRRRRCLRCRRIHRPRRPVGQPDLGRVDEPREDLGPDLVSGDFSSYWVYVLGPIAGAVVAVGAAYVLRGRGGGRAGSGAAQGAIKTKAAFPEKD